MTISACSSTTSEEKVFSARPPGADAARRGRGSPEYDQEIQALNVALLRYRAENDI
jgi:hypothetical protein